MRKTYLILDGFNVLCSVEANSQKEAEEYLERNYPEADRLAEIVCKWPEEPGTQYPLGKRNG